LINTRRFGRVRRSRRPNYSQGDGSKGVSYNNASIADLSNWIADLQRELARRGIGTYERRRAIGFNYGPERRFGPVRGTWSRQ
jgi:hypothetical protein